MSKITHTHAIVAVYASRWKVASARTPDQWSIIKIGRRTAKRIYLLEQKLEYRWPADTYYDAHAIVKCFPSAEAAAAFLDAAKAASAAEHEAYVAAREALEAAQLAARKALNAYEDAHREFVVAQTEAWAL